MLTLKLVIISHFNNFYYIFLNYAKRGNSFWIARRNNLNNSDIFLAEISNVQDVSLEVIVSLAKNSHHF